MATCTKTINDLLLPALEAVGTDRYAMAAALGFLTLWYADLVRGRELPIPADQMPPEAHTGEMVALTTWWELLGTSDEALFVEVAGKIRAALNDLDLD